jgi:hypothetical protein
MRRERRLWMDIFDGDFVRADKNISGQYFWLDGTETLERIMQIPAGNSPHCRLKNPHLPAEQASPYNRFCVKTESAAEAEAARSGGSGVR